MRKFTIVGKHLHRLYCDGELLCCLYPDIFKLPALEFDETIEVKELVLLKAGTLSCDNDEKDPWYSIEVGDGISEHCGSAFEHFTSKRYHLPLGGSMSVSTIKLLLTPRLKKR